MRDKFRRVGGPEIEDHACLISECEDRLRSICSFIIDGLRQDEGILLLADAYLQYEIFRILREQGIDCSRCLESGQLVAIYRDPESHMEDKKEPESISKLLGAAVESAGNSGYSSIRAVTDIAWICSLLKGNDIPQSIEALEALLSKSGCKALYQYDSRHFSQGIIQSALEIHPLAVIDGVAFRNPNMLSDEESLQPDLQDLRFRSYLNYIERQRREKEHIKRNEERLRPAVVTTGLGIWDRDIIEDKITWSRRTDEWLGQVQGSLEQAHKSFLKMMHACDHEHVEQMIENSLKGGSICRAEFRMPAPVGKTMWISSNGKVFSSAREECL